MTKFTETMQIVFDRLEDSVRSVANLTRENSGLRDQAGSNLLRVMQMENDLKVRHQEMIALQQTRDRISHSLDELRKHKTESEKAVLELMEAAVPGLAKLKINSPARLRLSQAINVARKFSDEIPF